MWKQKGRGIVRLPEWLCGEFYCLAPSPLHFWTRNQSILGLKFTPLGFRWSESYHSPGGEMRVHHYVPHRPLAFLRRWTPSMLSLALSLFCLLLITQRHYWSDVLSGICGPMSASACSQMATKTLWIMLPNSDHSLCPLPQGFCKMGGQSQNTPSSERFHQSP